MIKLSQDDFLALSQLSFGQRNNGITKLLQTRVPLSGTWLLYKISSFLPHLHFKSQQTKTIKFSVQQKRTVKLPEESCCLESIYFCKIQHLE